MDYRSRKRKRKTKMTSAQDKKPEPNLPEDSEKSGSTVTIPNFYPKDAPAASCAAVGVSPMADSASAPRQISSSSRLAHRRSPSPARMSLQKDHSEIKTLNERLSTQVEHVKELRAENARLKLQVQAMDGVIQRESHNMKQLHGSEITSLQDIIDACNDEKAALSTLYEEEKLERERLGAELWDKDVEIASLCDKLDNMKTMKEDYHKLQAESEMSEAALKEGQQDIERLNAELLKEKRCCQRLEQEAVTNKERYLKEVEEASARFSEHIQQADQKLEQGYEAMVATALSNLRQEHNRDLEGLKAELTSNYMSKIVEWKTSCEVAQADLLAAKREVKAIRGEQDRLKDLLTQLKADKAALEVQVEEAHLRLEEDRDRAERERCQSQRELALLTQELAEQKEELELMGGVNSRLEAEINAYKLIVEDLEGQKSATPRLRPETEQDNTGTCEISHDRKRRKDVKVERTGGKARMKKPGSVFDIYKRKDYFRTNDFSKGIEILDIDVSGRYITLVNSAEHPVDLCLWTIQQTDGHKKVRYELGGCTLLTHGKRLTIWSCDVGTKAKSGPLIEEGNAIDLEDVNEACSEQSPGKEFDADRYTDGDRGADQDGNVDVTMSCKAWFPLEHKLTVRVEDGDGQLQAKCDISNNHETGSNNTKTSAKASSSFSIAVSNKKRLRLSDSISRPEPRRRPGDTNTTWASRSESCFNNAPVVKRIYNKSKPSLESDKDNNLPFQSMHKDSCSVM